MRTRSEYSFLWVLYFFAVILVLGVPICLVTSVLLLIGLIFKPAQRLAEVLFAKGVHLLFSVQPWLTLQAQLPDPYDGTKPGVLLVSNHRSHLDVFVLLAHITGVRVLARKSLLWVLPIAPMLLILKQILVPRGDSAAYLRAMETIRLRLRRGETVHVFPEMTRCEPGMRGTRRFSSAAFHAALQEGARIIPIVIHNTDEAWPKGTLGIKRSVVRVEMLPAIQTLGKSANDVSLEARSMIDKALSP